MTRQNRVKTKQGQVIELTLLRVGGKAELGLPAKTLFANKKGFSDGEEMPAPLETPGELAGNPRGGVPSSVTKLASLSPTRLPTRISDAAFSRTPSLQAV